MSHFISPLWQSLSTGQWVLLILMLIAAISPYIASYRHKTSLALATTISILLVYVVQTLTWLIWWMGFGWHDPLILLIAFPDQVFHVGEWHRFISAAWIHSQRDITHVLGNALIIALVGVPLEQRLGGKRFMVAYILGAFTGNLAWCLANLGDMVFGLGASGAAFGLLGIYLACWPRDEIEFPLILIRRWPVQLIALLYFGMEIARAWSVYGLSQPSDVAHVAHLAGFLGCYAIARPLAKGGLIQPDVEDGGPTASGLADADRSYKKKGMGNVDSNPWDNSDFPLSKRASITLENLRKEGDELETREAWLDKLSEQAKCPICESDLELKGEAGFHFISCKEHNSHISWP